VVVGLHVFALPVYTVIFSGKETKYTVKRKAKTEIIFYHSVPFICGSGPGSVVDIATGYGLDGRGIESRWERDFPPVRTGPGAHLASCKMGTGSFPGVKSGWGVTLTPHPLLVPWSRKNRAISLLPL